MKDTLKKGLFLATCFLLMSVTGVQAQDFCEGNFDYDNDVDGTDAALFKTDFGRSTFKNPCPPDGPAPVPTTGQTKCYDELGVEIACQICIPPNPCLKTGQDGNLRKGAEWPNPRFTDNGNGTVSDNLTGLIWLKNAGCIGQRTWDNALSACNDLNSGECGLTDGSIAGEWRLPNRFELESLLDLGNYNPALPSGHQFIGVQNIYWSSTTSAYNTNCAWDMRMLNGHVDYSFKVNNSYVWCVRGGHE